METSPFPTLVFYSPRLGQRVRWEDPRHARALGWADALGPGPFEVVGFVDRRREGRPWGLLIQTELGEKEINEVWLTAVSEPGPNEGYSPDLLLALDDNTPPLDPLEED
jgi:hypothetical protein